MGLDQSSVRRPQLVQNAAARLLTRTRKHEHITPVQASLHWLPVRFRIDFKILLLVFKVLNGLAPPYLCELLHVHTPVKALRSSSQMALDVPRSRLKNRAFSVAAPNLWNSLPIQKRTAQFAEIFKSFAEDLPFFIGCQFELNLDTLSSHIICFPCLFLCAFCVLLIFELIMHFGQLWLFLNVL